MAAIRYSDKETTMLKKCVIERDIVGVDLPSIGVAATTVRFKRYPWHRTV